MGKHIIDISKHLQNNVDLLSLRINVFLTDLKGQILFEGQNIECIDITGHPKGHYIAFLTDTNGVLIKKIRVIKDK
jgi:hypothetical protein